MKINELMNTPTHQSRKFRSKVTLRYQEKNYTFLDKFEFSAENADAVLFNWTEGNYSCDCNRSDFIARYCREEDFPELECGGTIELLSLKAVEVGVVDGSIAPKELLA